MIGASIETTLELWASSLREVKKRIRPLFAQERAALNAGLFADGLLGDERRKTGWMRVNDGDAVVVKPMGMIAAGPLNRQKAILYAEIDKEAALRARRSPDICGHYSRPDVFSFSVTRTPLQPVHFVD
jgi:nitrilase